MQVRREFNRTDRRATFANEGLYRVNCSIDPEHFVQHVRVLANTAPFAQVSVMLPRRHIFIGMSLVADIFVGRPTDADRARTPSFAWTITGPIGAPVQFTGAEHRRVTLNPAALEAICGLSGCNVNVSCDVTETGGAIVMHTRGIVKVGARLNLTCSVAAVAGDSLAGARQGETLLNATVAWTDGGDPPVPFEYEFYGRAGTQHVAVTAGFQAQSTIQFGAPRLVDNPSPGTLDVRVRVGLFGFPVTSVPCGPSVTLAAFSAVLTDVSNGLRDAVRRLQNAIHTVNTNDLIEALQDLRALVSVVPANIVRQPQFVNFARDITFTLSRFVVHNGEDASRAMRRALIDTLVSFEEILRDAANENDRNNQRRVLEATLGGRNAADMFNFTEDGPTFLRIARRLGGARSDFARRMMRRFAQISSATSDGEFDLEQRVSESGAANVFLANSNAGTLFDNSTRGDAGQVRVRLPPELRAHLAGVDEESSVGIGSTYHDRQANPTAAPGTALRSSVVELDLTVDGESQAVTNFATGSGIEVRIRVDAGSDGSNTRCVALAADGNSWVRDGVTDGGFDAVNRERICFTRHFSSFAIEGSTSGSPGTSSASGLSLWAIGTLALAVLNVVT